MQTRVFSNAIWNVVNGSSSAVVAVLVPPFLTRALTPEAYGAWALALQIGTYVTLFGFGIQMAVGRYVAYAEAREDYVQRDGIVATAFWFLVAASAIGWLVICGVALSIHRLVPDLSVALVDQTRTAIILVGLALAINLPSSIFAAVFTGRQRSDIPAKIQGLGRLIQAGGLIVAGFTRSLAVLGLVYAAIAIATVITLAYAWKARTPAPTLALRHAGKRYGKELFSFCLSLTLWSFAMLLVSGLDLIILGRYDYSATAFFAVSVTLVNLVGGTLTSLANALIPVAASLPADPGGEHLKALLSRSSRLIMGASIMAGAPLIFEGHVLLRWWLGGAYAERAAAILAVLAVATIVRNALLPYVTLAIGTGYQRKMIATPLAEGLITVLVSVWFAQVWGATGVAYAKIVGGSCGVMLLLAQHPLSGPLGGLSRVSYFFGSVARPAIAILPVALVALALRFLPSSAWSDLVALAAVLATTALSVWFLALGAEDRRFAYDLAAARLRRSLPLDAR